jgi:hypothetical protein
VDYRVVGDQNRYALIWKIGMWWFCCGLVAVAAVLLFPADVVVVRVCFFLLKKIERLYR